MLYFAYITTPEERSTDRLLMRLCEKAQEEIVKE